MATNHHTGLDTLALERFVLHQIDDAVRDEFAGDLIRRSLRQRGIASPPQRSAAWKLLLNRVAGAELPLDDGRTVDAIVGQLGEIRDRGLLLARIEQYQQKRELDPTRLTPRVKEAMITALQELGVDLGDDAKFAAGELDEYLALAYASALRTAGGSADPIIAARMKTAAEPWDYTVRFYEDADDQGVVPHFIKAAGAIDYAFHLGEVAGAFPLAEHVVTLWENGVIDVGPETETKLFNYQENAIQRAPGQRALAYKRVLDLGDAKVMQGVVVNAEFPNLWKRLMTEVARFIQKREEQHDGARVSRQPLARAIRELQFNLSEFGSGGTTKVAQKLNAQLEDAMDILGATEVIEQLALGRRKSVWRVIERLHKELRGKPLNVTAVRTLAEEGNRIFSFVADFDATAPSDAFDAFVDAAEAWILAEGSLMEGGGAQAAAEEEESASDEEPSAELEGGEGEAASPSEAEEWD